MTGATAGVLRACVFAAGEDAAALPLPFAAPFVAPLVARFAERSLALNYLGNRVDRERLLTPPDGN